MLAPAPVGMLVSRMAALAWAACLGAATQAAETEPPDAPPNQMEYADPNACAACHADQQDAWRRSHHYRSMQVATPATILGDFEDARVNFHGIATRLFQDDGGYFVEAAGRSGANGIHAVRYAFGFEPLQQYLVDAGGGTLQALNVAWDARPAADGGQRWFHLQRGERITPQHPFFWARHRMNWATQCASCHSTGVERTFDERSLDTSASFAHANVACEACHGAGARHAHLAESGKLGDAPHAGFLRGLGTRPAWRFQAGTAIAEPVGDGDGAEIDMCGGCHSLRQPLTSQPVGKPYHEAHLIQLPSEGIYFADGQIREEAFVLGSFLQSRMHLQGVTCGNCHDPHDGGLVADGNAVCAQCHLSTVYDSPKHHRHATGMRGSACVDCHMPARTYMGVDDRRDHSFTVPRPALSAEIGVPNACASCHDRGDSWAAERLRAWGVGAKAHWGGLQRRLTLGDPRSLGELAAYIGDPTTAPIVKAVLLAQSANVRVEGLAGILQRALGDDEALVRRGAVIGARGLPAPLRWRLLAGLVDDPVAAVRFEVAAALSEVHGELPAAARADLGRLYAGYRRMLRASAGASGSQHALAKLALGLGDVATADRHFEWALLIEPSLLPALVDLADLRRAQQREGDAGSLLLRALEAWPGSGAANVGYAMHLVRTGRHREALAPLARADAAADAQPRFAYIRAVAQHSLGQEADAIATLRNAIERWPWSVDLLTTLVLYLDEPGTAEVRRHLDALALLAPDSPQVQSLRARYYPPR